MTAFGFDLSTKRIGLARPDGTTTSITARAGASDNLRRLNELVSAVDREVRRWPGTPLAVVEWYSLASPGRLALVRLGEIGGAVRLLLFDYGLDVVDVTPSSLKLEATGKAKVSKAEMIAAARARGAHVDNDDEADAWHLHDLGRRYLAGDALSDPLAALPWPPRP